MRKNPLGVMLSGAKHLVFSVTCEDEILRLRLRMTLGHSLRNEGDIRGGLSSIPRKNHVASGILNGTF
jgi:hypothetical protein